MTSSYNIIYDDLQKAGVCDTNLTYFILGFGNTQYIISVFWPANRWVWNTFYCSLGISPQFHQNIQCRFTLVRLWEQQTYNLLNDLHHIDRSMWEGTNSCPFSMELCICCSNPSMYSHWSSTNRMITIAQRVRPMRCTRSVIVIQL